MSDTSRQSDSIVSCVGCRCDGRARDLERFVHHDSVGLVHDMRRGAPGEPAFVHPQPGCLSAAAWGGFARVLDSRFEELEAESLVEEVRSGIETRLVERLGEAARHDELVAGDESVRRSMASGDVELAIVASDHETLDAWTREADAPVFAPLAGARLGEAVGVDRLAAVGIVPGPRADVVGRDAEKLICLEFDET